MAATTKAAAKATKAPAKKVVKKRPTTARAAAPAKKQASKATKKVSTAKAAPKKTTAKKAPPKKAAAKKAPAARKAPVKTAAPAKRAPAKKATPVKQVASPPKLPAAAGGGQAVKKVPPKRKGPLDKFLLGQVDVLTDERVTYLRQATSLKAEADLLVAEREPGDVQFDEESGEGDTLAVERERDLTLSAQASAAVEEIDIALAKIKDGTYGVCEQCNNIIPKERLRALPYAALCVQCKSAGFTRR
jgi:RNA polymerase-binding transcription factor DksA